MSLILNGTTGISDVDGTAAAPALTGTDTNTGIFFPAADTIAFAEGGAEAARFDSAGNLLVGTSTTGSAGISLSSAYNIGWGQSAGESIPNIFRQTSSAATVLTNGYRYSVTANGFASSYSSSFAKSAIALNEGSVRFYTDTAVTTAAGTDVTPTERARIDSSGNLLVAATSAPSSSVAGCRLNNPNTAAPSISRGSGTTEISMLVFINGNGTVGQITTNGSATAYVTSSDYRLKHDIQPMTGALAKVTALKPCTYKWKVDGSDGQGFIAHELDEVVPGCVTGEKDAVEEQQYEVTPAVKDEEGRIVTEAVMGTRTVPKYQGIDTSFLSATLTAALQELHAIVKAQAVEIADLKARLP